MSQVATVEVVKVSGGTKWGLPAVARNMPTTAMRAGSPVAQPQSCHSRAQVGFSHAEPLGIDAGVAAGVPPAPGRLRECRSILNRVTVRAPLGRPGSPPTTRRFEDREMLPACGSEEVVAGVGWNVEARQCLLEAFLAGRSAELVSKTEWEPGEAVIEYLRSLGGGAAEIWVDPSGSSDAYRWLRLIGCDFYPSDEVMVGVRPTPVFAQSCFGEG